MAQSAYRALLKALRRNVSTDPKKSHFKEFVAAEFRSHARITDEVVIKKKLDLARDYASLVIGVHNHKDLLLSYNIAVDRTEEEKRRLQNTAERVGLQLPKVYKEEENQL